MTNREAAILILEAFESLSLKYTTSIRMNEAFAMAIDKLMNEEENNENRCNER